VNTAPVAVNDSYSVSGAALAVVVPGVLGNDYDADVPANSLTAVLVDGPAHGVLSLSANGGFSYTPTSGFNGTDTFTYQANDGQTNSLMATVTITVSNQVQFRITSIIVSNGVAWITWNSVAGQTYHLQYKDSLSGSSWNDLPPDVTATGPTTTATNALGNATQRFYRVVLGTAAIPQPKILSLIQTNGVATITWSAVAGRSYRLQYKASLTDASWTDLLPDVPAIGQTAGKSDTIDSAPQRFYRIMLMP
jgi:VCBS repeat-containing protein